MSYHIYIDESGESGIAKVREGKKPGASPYFVLGAIVCEDATVLEAKNAILHFKKQIGKSSWKHATDLSHTDKVLLARMLGKLPVRYFAVISNKSTLGEYKAEISANPQKFYNKCVQYLLENICAYLIKAGANDNDLSIYLEHRNHDYDTMYRFLQKVKDNPLERQTKSLRILNPFAISTKRKGEDEMLEVADFVAHAIYQCSNKTPGNHFIPEPRYFNELSSRFAGNKNGLILGAGLKCIHNIKQLELDPDIRKMFEMARAKSPTRK